MYILWVLVIDQKSTYYNKNVFNQTSLKAKFECLMRQLWNIFKNVNFFIVCFSPNFMMNSSGVHRVFPAPFYNSFTIFDNPLRKKKRGRCNKDTKRII